MKFLFLINDIQSLVPTQTTAMLMLAAFRRGHRVGVLTVTDLGLEAEGSVSGSVRFVEKGSHVTEIVASLQEAATESVNLGSFDLLMIRTNPARDRAKWWAHETALMFARILRERGMLVLNDPDGLVKASSKLYLSSFPQELVPKTFVSHDIQAIREFANNLEKGFVIKPLQGTRGKDVFFFEHASNKNFRQIVDVVTREGFAMVQEFLPEAVNGDIRVVVMNGNALMKDGHYAAIGRIPAQGDLRSNLHAGGKAALPTITPGMRAAIEEIGPQLMQDGIWLAGLDFIGDKILEINVFSTGGLRNAEEFTEICFSDMIITEAERLVDVRQVGE